jgi:hypothetical protein
MTTARISVARSAYMLGIGALTVMALWPWLQGPASIALSSFTGWFGSGIITERRAWATALAQGIVSGLAIWVTLRWLSS